MTDRDQTQELVRVGAPPSLAISVEFLSQRRVTAGRIALPVFPTARAELLFHFGDPFLAGETAEATQPLPAAALLRPRDERYAHVAGPRIDWFLVALTPVGCRRLLGFPMAKLWKDDRPLSSFWGDQTGHLHRALADLASFAERIDLMTEFLAGLDQSDGDEEIGQIADQARKGTIRSIRDMCEALQIGPRRLRQRFVAEIGIAPKRFLSVLRFGRHLAATHPAPWLRDPNACGTEYVDESHACREFHRFAEVTPAAYRRSKLAGDSLVFTGVAVDLRDG
ncbi:MAG: helix-turn-helix domain-containing protein [Sphingosinicella sp.]|uniref:helix-turn-helix domain-containing protein n=1 Tax=Sphingosinicella sp. TaxID=1917971 RepID=UPI0040378A99